MDALAQAGWRLDAALIVVTTSNGTRNMAMENYNPATGSRLGYPYQDESIMVVQQAEAACCPSEETGGA